jgi:hypothetical protein
MFYRKPLLSGYPALFAIQETGPNAKTEDLQEQADPSKVTDPAYQADE